MEINAALTGVLTALSEALEDPGADVSETLQLLAADARAAVPSYLGVAVMMTVSGEPLVMTAMEDGTRPVDVRTSLRIPLDNSVTSARTAARTTTDVALVLFASTPGAFVDLAADVIWLSGRDPSHVVVDGHLELAEQADDASALAAISTMNQAIGVLIARGFPPEQAQQQLDRLAAAGGFARIEAARAILAELVAPPTAEPGSDVATDSSGG